MLDESAFRASTGKVWSLGQVDQTKEHFALSYGSIPETRTVALVGPLTDGLFVVQILLEPTDARPADILRAVLDELDFYLGEVGGPDPWTYAKYHCGTMSNIYSSVHWSFLSDAN